MIRYSGDEALFIVKTAYAARKQRLLKCAALSARISASMTKQAMIPAALILWPVIKAGGGWLLKKLGAKGIQMLLRTIGKHAARGVGKAVAHTGAAGARALTSVGAKRTGGALLKKVTPYLGGRGVQGRVLTLGRNIGSKLPGMALNYEVAKSMLSGFGGGGEEAQAQPDLAASQEQLNNWIQSTMPSSPYAMPPMEMLPYTPMQPPPPSQAPAQPMELPEMPEMPEMPAMPQATPTVAQPAMPNFMDDYASVYGKPRA